MNGRLLTLYLAALPLCVLARPAHAQQPASDMRNPVRPFVGMAFGRGTFPGAFDPACGYTQADDVPALAAEARAGVGLGRFRVESRTTVQAAAVLEACLTLPPSHEQGLHTVRLSALERGSFKLTDLRLGYRFGNTTHLVAWGGAGWVWGRDVPVFVAGAGVGMGSIVRVGIDFDAVTYRIPWDIVTAEWLNHEIVNEISREREYGWRYGYSIRLAFEIAPRLFR